MKTTCSSSFITARRYASAVFAVIVCPSVCPSVRHEPVLYQKNWTNRAGFWHGGFLTPIPLCAVKKFGYLQKLRNFSLELCTKLRTQKISSRQVDRVVNKTRRRRRRSSLLTTSIRQSTSRGCLLQVGRLQPKTPLLRFVVDLLYDLFLQLTAF